MYCPLLTSLQGSWSLFFLKSPHCSLTYICLLQHSGMWICRYVQLIIHKKNAYRSQWNCTAEACLANVSTDHAPVNSRQLKLQMSRAYCQECARGQNCCSRLAQRQWEGEAGGIRTVNTNPSERQKCTWHSWVSSMLPIVKKVLASHNYTHLIEVNLLCEPIAVFSPSPNRSW